jgi:hypothetical protein
MEGLFVVAVVTLVALLVFGYCIWLLAIVVGLFGKGLSVVAGVVAKVIGLDKEEDGR